jgi:hypothetical protein
MSHMTMVKAAGRRRAIKKPGSRPGFYGSVKSYLDPGAAWPVFSLAAADQEVSG